MATILAVDDDLHIRELIEATLSHDGHEVTLATNGTDAVNKLKKRKFDVVILDIMMPEMDGYQLLDKIREMPNRSDTPCIVLTAKHDPAGVQRELRSGAVDHLTKPFLPSELEEAVARALEGGDTAVEERRRVLEHGAEMFGSMQELYEDVRNHPDARPKK